MPRVDLDSCAITGGCEEIWTNDQRLATAAAGRLRVAPLR
jgi:hypothetical protein